MTGFELLQWKRTQPYIRRIPVVVLTIDKATSAINAAYDLGANSTWSSQEIRKKSYV